MSDILRLVEQHVREARAEADHIELARNRLIRHLDEIERLLPHLDEMAGESAAAASEQAEPRKGLTGTLQAVGLQLEQALGSVIVTK